MKEKSEPSPEEFKVIYALEGSLDLLSKYFMAIDFEDAKKMFEFVCEKNDLSATIQKVEKWNRWNSTWETQEELVS